METVREREREQRRERKRREKIKKGGTLSAPSVARPPFRRKASGLETESTKALCAVGLQFVPLTEAGIFALAGVEWSFPSGNRMWGEYQGLAA